MNEKRGRKGGLFSVITITYNDSSNIERTIESVLSQRYENVEYIVVDGKSTDGTVDIIEKYSDRITKWVSEPDRGIYDAMNKGIEMASGDYLNTLNAGDYYYDEGVLHKVMEVFASFPECQWIYSRAENRHEYRDSKLAFLNDIKYFSNCRLDEYTDVSHQGVFYKKELHQKLGLYDLRYRSAADHDFLIRVNKAVKSNRRFLDCTTVVRSKDEYSASSTLRHAMEMKEIEDRLLGRSLKNELRYYKSLLKLVKKTDLGLALWGRYMRLKHGV